MRLEVLVKGVAVPSSFKRCGRFRKVGEVLSWSFTVHCMYRARTNTYKRLTGPVLVYMILRPLVALFVRLQVVPGVATTIAHEQPPPRIVGEGLFSRRWNIKRRVQSWELAGRHECGGSRKGCRSEYLTVRPLAEWECNCSALSAHWFPVHLQRANIYDHRP